MQRAPMYVPGRICLRMTAYHIVVASRVPWMTCHGRGGGLSGGAIPASTSWRRVAT